MAWRIREHVLSGEVDNRTKGRVRGFLEWAGTGERILEARGSLSDSLDP